MLFSFYILIGLIGLFLGSNLLVSSSLSLAKKIGISSTLAGTVIVGFGTSLPEVLTGVFSALNDAPNLLLGNVYGSNISNIALALGIGMFIQPSWGKNMQFNTLLILLLASTFIGAWMLLNLKIDQTEGWVSIALFIGAYCVMIANNKTQEEEPIKSMKYSTSVVFLVSGLVMLSLGAYLFVLGSINLAYFFGVGELLIGLTVSAIGTSLPEIFVSVIAISRNHPALALGNIIGSNIINLLLAIGAGAVITPLHAQPDIITRDLPVHAFFIALLVFLILVKKRISRLSAAFLLLSYGAYMAWLFNDALILST